MMIMKPKLGNKTKEKITLFSNIPIILQEHTWVVICSIYAITKYSDFIHNG